jgi:hypothetical protein
LKEQNFQEIFEYIAQFQKNKHIHQLNSATQTYFSMIKWAEGKLSNHKLLESFEQFFGILLITGE